MLPGRVQVPGAGPVAMGMTLGQGGGPSGLWDGLCICPRRSWCSGRTHSHDSCLVGSLLQGWGIARTPPSLLMGLGDIVSTLVSFSTWIPFSLYPAGTTTASGFLMAISHFLLPLTEDLFL